MSGGEGVRNPADLTAVLNLLDGIAFWQAFYFNWILDDLEGIDNELDDIDTAIETNRLLLLVVQAGVATIIDNIDTLEDHILIALGDVADTIDTLSHDTAVIAHKDEARTRVYPQDTRVTQTLICAGAADTFGAWAEVVPIDTIGFIYKVIGLVVEETDAMSTFLIQLGYSTDAGTDPTTAQIMGERRIKLLGAPIKLEKEILEILGCHAPANAKLWGRIKSASGAADELDISVVVTRHIGVTNEIEHLTTWPWAT